MNGDSLLTPAPLLRGRRRGVDFLNATLPGWRSCLADPGLLSGHPSGISVWPAAIARRTALLSDAPPSAPRLEPRCNRRAHCISRVSGLLLMVWHKIQNELSVGHCRAKKRAKNICVMRVGRIKIEIIGAAVEILRRHRLACCLLNQDGCAGCRGTPTNLEAAADNSRSLGQIARGATSDNQCNTGHYDLCDVFHNWYGAKPPRPSSGTATGG